MNSEEIRARFAPATRSKRFNRILDALGLRSKKVLDLGCGYGEYLVHFGPGSVGLTTTLEEVEYGKQNGIDIRRGNVELIEAVPLPADFDAVWANNLIEYVLSPHAFLMKLRRAAPQAQLIISCDVIPGVPLLMRLKKFRGALAVGHVSMFTLRTFTMSVERAGWRIVSVRPFVFKNEFLDYLFSFIAPHVYCIAENNKEFVYSKKKLKEWQDDPLYADMLAITGQTK